MPILRGPKLPLMPSFGQRLKHERETRNKTIEEIAAATDIHLSYLEALENNEFHALPGRAFGKLYIRTYAELLGFDPQPLIDDYDREQQLKPRDSTEPPPAEAVPKRRVEAVIASWREARMTERSKPERGVASVEPQPDRPAEAPCDMGPDAPDGEPREAREDEIVEAPRTEPVEGWREETAEIEQEVPDEAAVLVVSASETGARSLKTTFWSNRSVVALLFVGLLMGAVGTYFTFFRTGIDESGPPSTVTIEQEIPGKDPPPVEPARVPRPVHAALPPKAPRSSHPVTGATTAPGHLTVPEFGVGRRIVKRDLEGQDERFAEGDVVWFSTRVLGGAPGQPIRHLWLHEGSAVQSIELGLGGPDWRTHSSKKLRNAGQWAVEARDEEGRTLARATFTCGPAGP